jgi:hypothetical protein
LDLRQPGLFPPTPGRPPDDTHSAPTSSRTEAYDPRAWLRAALAKGLARSVRHEGCLRYAWPLGQNARARRRVEVAMAAREFPVWDAGQLPLFT